MRRDVSVNLIKDIVFARTTLVAVKLNIVDRPIAWHDYNQIDGEPQLDRALYANATFIVWATGNAGAVKALIWASGALRARVALGN